MPKESEPQPQALADELLTPELAATELAERGPADGHDGDRTRTRPRNEEPREEPRAVGRFRIDAMLGSGGMGDVYRAYDTVLDRAVALKVLRTDRSADGTQGMRRVVREARAAAALVHPNAVTVFDVGEADGEVFIAMELLEGEDLRSKLERGDASLEDKLRWLLEAARALGAAHERGLVHRDVKPENMFVCKSGTLKLLDFGIAKRDDDDAAHPADAPAISVGPSSLRTTEGRRVGTPRYMAPEQHAGESTDARTDEYAWGLVAFELLTGTHIVADLRTMTTDGSEVASGAEASSERREVLRAKLSELPEAITETVARALEPRKESRFPSMAPIIAALESRAPSPSVPTPQPPTAEPPRRDRWRLAGALTLTALAATGAWLRLRHHEPIAPRVVAPACRVASTRTLTVGADDRVAVLSDGSIVIARDIRRGLVFEREPPGGGVTAPFLRTPVLAALGKDYGSVRLAGIVYHGAPALLIVLFQGERGAFFGAWAEHGEQTSKRIFGEQSGIASTALGDEIVAIATTREVPSRPFDLPNGAEALLLGGQAATRTTLEVGGANAPAVATSGERVAVAYAVRGAIHFALLDRRLERLGDVLTVAPFEAVPAVAFAGDSATVFWMDDSAGKMRLTAASFTPGEPAFSAPKVASDDPLSARPPLTARLPNGAWAVAWVASMGGLSTLRVSPVGAGGLLTGPTDVAKGATIDGLQATSTERGVDYWWYESNTTVRVAQVTCGSL